MRSCARLEGDRVCERGVIAPQLIAEGPWRKPGPATEHESPRESLPASARARGARYPAAQCLLLVSSTLPSGQWDWGLAGGIALQLMCSPGRMLQHSTWRCQPKAGGDVNRVDLRATRHQAATGLYHDTMSPPHDVTTEAGWLHIGLYRRAGSLARRIRARARVPRVAGSLARRAQRRGHDAPAGPELHMVTPTVSSVAGAGAGRGALSSCRC